MKKKVKNIDLTTTKKKKKKQKQKQKNINLIRPLSLRTEEIKRRGSKNIHWDREVPDDISELILSMLPVSNLPTCRSVCNSWNNLVLRSRFLHDANPKPPNLFFAHIYPHSSKFYCLDLDPKHLETIRTIASFRFRPSWLKNEYNNNIIGSCNGLFLFCTHRFLYVLNPMTNECIKFSQQLEPFIEKNDFIDYDYDFGFGFCCNLKQYKIVRFSSYATHCTRVEIFTFASTSSSTLNGKWTQLADVPLQLEPYQWVYFNGALYLIGFHQTHPLTPVLFRFDLEEEKFDDIPISFPHDLFPHFELEEDMPQHLLGVLNDVIYLAILSITFDSNTFYDYTVWMMDQHSSTWIKAFVVHIPPRLESGPSCGLKLIKVCDDGKILCLYDGYAFILHDPITDTSQLLPFQDDRAEKSLIVYQIDSFNFAPLHKILPGDVN